MTAESTIRKLILYAETKRRLKEPEDVAMRDESVLALSSTSRRLRKELTNEGVSPKLLNLSGDEIAEVIYDTIHIYV